MSKAKASVEQRVALLLAKQKVGATTRELTHTGTDEELLFLLDLCALDEAIAVPVAKEAESVFKRDAKAGLRLVSRVLAAEANVEVESNSLRLLARQCMTGELAESASSAIHQMMFTERGRRALALESKHVQNEAALAALVELADDLEPENRVALARSIAKVARVDAEVGTLIAFALAADTQVAVRRHIGENLFALNGVLKRTDIIGVADCICNFEDDATQPVVEALIKLESLPSEYMELVKRTDLRGSVMRLALEAQNNGISQRTKLMDAITDDGELSRPEAFAWIDFVIRYPHAVSAENLTTRLAKQGSEARGAFIYRINEIFEASTAKGEAIINLFYEAEDISPLCSAFAEIATSKPLMKQYGGKFIEWALARDDIKAKHGLGQVVRAGANYGSLTAERVIELSAGLAAQGHGELLADGACAVMNVFGKFSRSPEHPQLPDALHRMAVGVIDKASKSDKARYRVNPMWNLPGFDLPLAIRVGRRVLDASAQSESKVEARHGPFSVKQMLEHVGPEVFRQATSRKPQRSAFSATREETTTALTELLDAKSRKTLVTLVDDVLASECELTNSGKRAVGELREIALQSLDTPEPPALEAALA